jgi:FdhD protein
VLAREDVGRHVLDKLIGAGARPGPRRGFRAWYPAAPATDGQQRPRTHTVAVSAPTALAVRLAAEAGITLVAFARAGRLSVYTRPERVL